MTEIQNYNGQANHSYNAAKSSNSANNAYSNTNNVNGNNNTMNVSQGNTFNINININEAKLENERSLMDLISSANGNTGLNTKDQILGALGLADQEGLGAIKGNALLYNVEEGTEAADVPEYWNAENTSQRIVDFAMSFWELHKDDEDFETYFQDVMGAIEDGFGEAKDILGDLPGESAQLFNDTYTATMDKLNEIKEDPNAYFEKWDTSVDVATVAPEPFEMVA